MPLRSLKATPLQGEIRVPGDKSISHRALMFGGLAVGETRITGLLEGEDVLATAAALRAYGCTVVRDGDDGASGSTWRVRGLGVGGLHEPSEILDLGNSGTATRLLIGIAAAHPFTSFFTGDASLRSRPMARITTPLGDMGARFVARTGGRLPLAVMGSDALMPIDYTLPVASAQVKSAILLAGLHAPGETTVVEPQPTRDHTELMLRHFGATVRVEDAGNGGRRVTVTGQPELVAADIIVPADPSSAAFALVAAAIVPGSVVRCPGVGINPLRTGLLDTLLDMGADITFENRRVAGGEPVADLVLRHAPLKGVVVPAERAPRMIDEYPVLAVAASCATGRTVMHGLGELRAKESDRLSAIATGLRAAGATLAVDGDTLTVEGTGTPPAGGATVAANLDHRIAMAFLVLGAATARPMQIDDGRTIDTSFPGFAPLMNAAGLKIDGGLMPDHPMPVIAVDGPSASGKGTLARRLAEHFGFHWLDTGLLYRAVAWRVPDFKPGDGDPSQAITVARTFDAAWLAEPDLRGEVIGRRASQVSVIPEVRAALLAYQQGFARQSPGAVLDGRDIGTVVCPDAAAKLFLTASVEVRAARRLKELRAAGTQTIYAAVLQDLIERDRRDTQRAAAPLTRAADALLLDTSGYDADQAFAAALALIEPQII